MSLATQAKPAGPLKTPLHRLHLERGGKMVPFAGYELPVHYPLGVLGEHLHTREKAGLFDVSHMGQAFLASTGPNSGPGHQATAAALEKLVPGDIAGLVPGEMRYTLLLNEQGGIRDDLMVTRTAEAGRLFLVVNAACKQADFAYIEANLPAGMALRRLEDRALLALQGPQAARVLARLGPEIEALDFMTAGEIELAGMACFVSRSGYTGEDGFEISVPAASAERLARQLLSHEEVALIGLGARDSLRLEAGLCLYGHDIDETTTPVEAALSWTIARRRREEANFPGAHIILDQIATGTARKRVGLLPEGKAPAREGTGITDMDGNAIGRITSGGFGPTLGGPIAMGYVKQSHAAIGSPVTLMVRGKGRPARIVPMPFVPKHFYRKSPSKN